MIEFGSLSLYFSKNSSAPEKATSLMYLLTSSAVIPIPLSLIVMVFFLASKMTLTFKSFTSCLTSPAAAKVINFCEASTALDTNSLKNISVSE